MNQVQLQILEDLKVIDLSKFATKAVSTDQKNTYNIFCECGSDDVNVVMRQTRSGDEETTKFYTCRTCGNKWRQG